MKIYPSHLQDRVADVGGELRNAERISPSASMAIDDPTIDRAIRDAAESIAQSILAGRTKHRDVDFEFTVRGWISDAVKQWPARDAEKVWQFGDGHQLQDKLEAALTQKLASAGFKSERIEYSRDNMDQLLELRVRGVQPVPAEPSARAVQATEGPKTSATITDLHTAKNVLASASSLMDEAALTFGKHYEEAFRRGYLSRADPKLIHTVTVSLEKAAAQLSKVRLTPELGRAVGLDAELKAVQQSYVRLMYGLIDAPNLYSDALEADRKLKPLSEGGRPTGSAIERIMSQFSATKKLLKGEAVGGYERRLQQALVSLYDNAPIFASGRRDKLPAHGVIGKAFSFATPEMVADPKQAAVLAGLGAQFENAANAEAAGQYERAKSGHRHVAFELLHHFGPSMVTAEALIRLGDFEESFGRNDKASRVHVAAMQIMKEHLPDNHVLMVETAKKLERTGTAWLKSLDPDGSKPMPYKARGANATADSVREALKLDAILAQTRTTDAGPAKASAEAWKSGLEGAKPGENFSWQAKTERESWLYRQVHYGICGPMSI